MNKLNILIVEDESLVAMGLEQDIIHLGYNVVDYATTPKIAIELFKKNKIDILIMDIDLKDVVNGVNLYKSFTTDIPVIYISGHKDDSVLCDAIQTNPIGYLIKPYNVNNLDILLKMAKKKIFEKQKLIISFVNFGDGYSFSIEEQKLFHYKKEIHLTKKELKLIILLLEAKEEIVSYKIIEEELYMDEYMSSSAFRTLSYRLKKKLDYKFIETKYSTGICLKLDKKNRV